jgi:hypothetical protein
MRTALIRAHLGALAVLVALLAGMSVRAVVYDPGGNPNSGADPTPPLINRDHWHAPYQVIICGQPQPPFPQWSGGIHTHADGIIHLHPFLPSEQGAGARLVKFFEYGGGLLTQTQMRMPGSRTAYENGDTCPDGSAAVLRIFVNDQPLDGWDDYIPQDGDNIRIVFGPGE